MERDASAQAGLEPGRNCWRIERATRATVIIDAADYFDAAREAMMAAEKRIMLIGWDFDARIRIGLEEDDLPPTIGEFVLRLVERKPELEVYLLRWDVGAVKALFRGTTPLTVLQWELKDRIHVKLDGDHPPGASHHQKIVVVDDCFAFCGGIDMTTGRWDRRDHLDEDEARIGPDGKPHGPWHDATMALEGPVAAALGELARDRWALAGGKAIDGPVRRTGSCWPEKLGVQFEDVDVAISRTHPNYGESDEVREIEALYLDLIARAERHIYAESQYFASRKIAEAIARRLDEPDGPEIVLVNPEQADGWLEQKAMDTARARLHEALRRRDVHGRFRIYHPFTEGGEPIYVHAKILVIDDRILRVGSSNMNNRSLGLDTECDVTIDFNMRPDGKVADVIRETRDGLMAEHLGVERAEVAAAIDETGSLIQAIERLRGAGRSLRPYEREDLSDVEKYLADNEVLDPEAPEEMFEAIGGGGLWRRLRKPWKT